MSSSDWRLTYGADLSRWPADRRAAAERLLAETPELAEVLAGARRLDEAFQAQNEEIDDLRLVRLKAALRERAEATPPPRLRWIQVLFGADLSALATGALAALSIAWLVQSARPEPPPAAGASPPPNAILAILELDSAAFLEPTP